jgi:hypothetical protein
MSHRSKVIKYIENQQEHHKKTTFKQEYIEILRKLDIKYNTDYLFNFFE